MPKPIAKLVSVHRADGGMHLSSRRIEKPMRRSDAELAINLFCLGLQITAFVLAVILFAVLCVGPWSS